MRYFSDIRCAEELRSLQNYVGERHGRTKEVRPYSPSESSMLP